MSTNILIQTSIAQFAEDVRFGLSSSPKALPSKYFYDKEGSKLFQQIMGMPEYYLTNSEQEIMETYKDKFLELFGPGAFKLIELGAGDGKKTKILLRHFLEKGARFSYTPLDISGNILKELKADLLLTMPGLTVNPVQGDYFKSLDRLPFEEGIRRAFLFMGANIGNMQKREALSFVRTIAGNMRKNDLLLIGFDLKKDPAIILNAYNDAAGITRDFNLNLLHRINRELGGTFDVSKFRHWESYDPLSGDTKSYLVSTEKQSVFIEAFGIVFHFEAWEAVQTELSKKYDLREIQQLANEAGFRVKDNFLDRKEYFVNSLWEA